MKTAFPSQPVIHRVTDAPVVAKIGRVLKTRHTRIYPTRHLPLCPPAYAGLVNTAALGLPELPPQSSETTLLVFVPPDYASSLHVLAAAIPTVRLHPDVSLQAQRAYLSWSAPAVRGALPLTLWVQLSEVSDALVENALNADGAALPVVLAAGDTVAVGGFAATTDLLRAWDEALVAQECPPTGYTAQELARAREKAERYSDLPWTFMRYELKNREERLAVNFAPVQREQGRAES